MMVWTAETDPPWPPERPLRPSRYGVIFRRSRRGEHGNFSVEPADGGALTSQQLDLGLAVSGGWPLDMTDPNVLGWR